MNLRKEAAPLGICVFVGLALSCLPYLLWWPYLGEPLWLADSDELYYLSLASQAYHDHPLRLGSETGGAIHPWLQLGPGILAAKALGLGPLRIGFLWRIFAGISIPIGWYLLLRRFLSLPWLVCAGTVVLLSDVGLLSGWLLAKQILVLARCVLGRPGDLFENFPSLHYQWRISSPGLTLIYLLLYALSIERAKERPTLARILLAGTGLGVLFVVNSFYWTAAGLSLLALIFWDSARRAVYFKAGIIGTGLGLPWLLFGFKSALPEALQRMDILLPIPRLSEFLVPKLGIALVSASGFWVYFRRRDLISLWTLAFAALALLNQQIVSGLQVQNYHWSFVWGPILCLVLVLAALGALEGLLVRSRRFAWALGTAVAVHASAGFWLRSQEALKTRSCINIMEEYRRYRGQFLIPGVSRLKSGAVAAGDYGFMNFAVILHNLRPLTHEIVAEDIEVSNRELDERIALNSYLMGQNRRTFEKAQRNWVARNVWGPEFRDSRLGEERIAVKLRLYDEVARDSGAVLDRYKVRYLALPSGGALPAVLVSGWRRLEDGPTWQVWERTAAVAQAPAT